MTIRAKIEDATHLTLMQPIDAEVGSFVMLKITDVSERHDFLTASAALLERAYGDGEPDYSNAGTPIELP